VARQYLHLVPKRRRSHPLLSGASTSRKVNGEEDGLDHIKRIADEFGRQAQTFDTWAEKTDDRVAERFRAALGDVRQGKLLDIACGPGVVTAAIAPGAASVVAFDA